MNWRQNLPPSYNRCGAAHSPSARSRSGFASSAIFTDHGQFFRSYLIAYMFWLGIPLGCLGIVMIHHLVGGTWGFVIQRSLESATRTFPIMAVLFLPLLFRATGFIYLGAPASCRPGSGAAAKSRLSQYSGFYHPRGGVFRSLVRPRVFSKPLVGGTGPERRPRAHAAAANSQRAGAGPVRTHGNFFRHRLADVAGAALVLDDLRHALHGQPRY